ncbi:hypothetical protein ACFQHV_10335 [Promicromonospora thailandica]|uniref:hypothetical protein n=1 Tax=Promicromonospora thailandica TaxID=765201 RepID=UPI0020A5412C|nr:hypothetical protein [Promicromonospora thailandica]BFF18864.1 hypothetical protein GCM10025730_23850 [Promicromonospora thailandica]
MDEPNPRAVGEYVQMLKGKSAASMTMLSARMALLVGASVIATAVLAVILGSGFGERPLFGFILAVIFLLIVATVVVHSAGKIKEAREFHAGYTTIMRAHISVDQVDPDSSRVVRSAGEKFLTKDIYETRMARIRATGGEDAR